MAKPVILGLSQNPTQLRFATDYLSGGTWIKPEQQSN
jgi:hypothetical protein